MNNSNHHYTYYKYVIIQSSINLVLNLSLFALILYYKAYRKTRFELIIYILILLLLDNIVKLLPYSIDFNQCNKENEIVSICAIQSFMLSYLECAILLISTFMSYCVLLTAIRDNYLDENIEYYRKFVLPVIFLIPLPFPIA